MGRTEQIEHVVDQRGAEWIEKDDRSVVDHYGDPNEEYRLVAEKGLGVVERGERDALVVRGPETIPWLQGLVTSDLHDLVDEGSGQRTAVVNSTGRFVGEARVLHIPELLLLDLEAGNLTAGLESHLKGQIILEDVELADKTESTWRVGLYGDDALDAVSELAAWRHDLGELAQFCGTWARWNGTDLIAQRSRWMNPDGFEILCPVDVGADLLERIDDITGELPLIGDRAFETLRIEAGIPRFGAELDDKVIPLEAGFDDAIAYDKGCYLGQEIIARLDSRGTPAKLLRKLVFESDQVPDTGADIYPADGGDRSIGEVKTAVYSPRFDAAVGLGFVKRKHNDLGEAVVVDGAEGRIEALYDFGG